MTLQIIFFECEIIEKFRRSDTKVIQVNERQLWSPRWKHFILGEVINIKNGNVLYICYTQNRFNNVYDFLYSCKCNSSNRNRFLLKPQKELEDVPFEKLLEESEVYHPVSGDKLKHAEGVRSASLDKLPITSSIFIKAYLIQGCHILREWKKAGLLESKRSILNVNGTVLEMETSKGNHLILDKSQGWIYNTSTHIVGLLIDYYQIDGEMPYAQMNFSNDAEYRFKVASYLFNVLKAFCLNNINHLSNVGCLNNVERLSNPTEAPLTSVEDVIRCIILILN